MVNNEIDEEIKLEIENTNRNSITPLSSIGFPYFHTELGLTSNWFVQRRCFEFMYFYYFQKFSLLFLQVLI